MSYRISGIVDDNDVPDWQRTPPKWRELVDAVLALEPGKSLRVEFATPTEAERGQNAVRTQANLEAQAIIVRTRKVDNPDGTATVYFARVHPVEK